MSLEDELYQQRIRRIAEIEALGFRAYGHRFDASHTIPQILAEYGEKTAEQLEPRVPVRIAGRITHHSQNGQGRFRASIAERRAPADLRTKRLRPSERFRSLRAFGNRRHYRRRGLSVSDQDR